MPTVPGDPQNQMAAATGSPADPTSFLMAAAEMHSKGEFQSAPVPEGKALQTGKPAGKRHHMKVVR